MILIDAENMFKRHWSITSKYAFEEFLQDAKDGLRTEPTLQERKDLMRGFMNVVFNEILFFKKKYSRDYGRILIAEDSANPWRKRIWPIYKAHRKRAKKKTVPGEEHIWTDYHMSVNKVLEILDNTPFLVLKDLYAEDKHGVEADDIIGVITKNLPEKHLIISTDGDFKQCCNQRVKQYSPLIKKIKDTPTKKEIYDFLNYSYLMGQAKDNIKAVTFETELSEDFIKWVKEKHDIDIDQTFVSKIKKQHHGMILEYELEKEKEDDKLLLEGKRKQRRNLTAFSKPKFGEATARKWLEDLDSYMEVNPLYKENYERNKKLMNFDFIDEDIQQIIKDEIQVQQSKEVSMNWVMDLMDTFNDLGLEKVQGKEGEFA